MGRAGHHHGAAFDLQAVCSGFVFGLATADGLLKTGAFKRALVIGSETFSRILDWKDRGTCVLFGDGAGAVGRIAAAARHARGPRHPHRPSALGRTPQVQALCRRPSSTMTVGHLRMEGRAVFKHAVAMVTDVIEDAFKATGYTADDIDWFVPHQANQRIIDDTAKKLGLAPERWSSPWPSTATPRRPRSRWRSRSRRRRPHQAGRPGDAGSMGGSPGVGLVRW